jgi:hypothetical protein
MTPRGARFIKERAKRAALSTQQFRRDLGLDDAERPAPAALSTTEKRARNLWLALQSHDEEARAKAHSFFSMCSDELRAEVLKLAGANDKFKRPPQKLKVR